MSKVVLIYSGGMDSTTLLYHLLDRGDDVRALGIDYGQRHVKELKAAKVIASKLGVEYEVADLQAINHLLKGSSLTSAEVGVPDGHYAAETMKATVVPNRNMIMIAIATGWAISTGSEAVAYAAHAGDHAIYPDCRSGFTDALDLAMHQCHFNPIILKRPFITITKADIVKRGMELNVPYRHTWTCYRGNDIHCGKCSTCTERLEAFDLAGFIDPVEYVDRETWKGVIKRGA